MAYSDAEYDIISPFTLPVQTGNNNNNDVPESTLGSSRIHTVDFDGDGDGSCVFITDTPIDDAGELDPYEDSDSDSGFGSPSSLPRIRFIDHVRAKAAGVRGRRREPRAQGEPDPGYTAFLESIERQQRSTPDQITMRLGMEFRPIRSPRDSAVSVGDDATRSATRPPARLSPIVDSLWDYTLHPPSVYGIPPPPGL
jgi:hypothetical protein